MSEKPEPLYLYFKQLFAQVTNPPIDAIREEVFTDTTSAIGPEKNLIDPQPDSCRQISAESPILSNIELAKLKNIKQPKFEAATLPILFPVEKDGSGLRKALNKLCQEADKMIAEDKCILILSDRGVNKEMAPIPSLLACACLHHHLIRNGTRLKASIILESGEPREVHHFALLLGYGASGINPYLAFETIDDMCSNGMLSGISFEKATDNYIDACTHGIAKVLSKMGISTVASYRGGQLFEAVGLSKEVVDTCFIGVPSRIEGATFADLENDQKKLADLAWKARKPIDQGGMLKFVFGKEYHAFNPDVINALHKSVRSGKYEDFKEYANLVNSRPVATIRDLFKLKTDNSISVDEVESSFLARFKRIAWSKCKHKSIAT